MGRSARGMRDFWDDAAKRSAAYYVDTRLDFEHPDMDEFFRTGQEIVRNALVDGPVQPTGRELAVEIGCGLGRNCLALTEHFDRVVGVDIAPEMVRQARELITDQRISFEVGDGTTLTGVADASADFVLSFTVFQHIPDVAVIEGYIAEAGRVLRPGGVFSFQWNNEPGARAWRLKRRVLATLQRTGIHGEARGRNALQFLGSKVPLDRIDKALGESGMTVAGTTGLGTLFAWCWAQKR